MFTKLLKPVFKVLREKGLLSSAYIDDLYLQGDTFHECLENSLNTVQLLRDLGFVVQEEKVLSASLSTTRVFGLCPELSVNDGTTLSC